MRTATIIIAMLALAACAVEQGPHEGRLGPHVSVHGEARIEVTPDRLTVRARVTQLADEVADATGAVDRRTAAALDAARNAGVAERDVRALAITVQPIWDWHEGQRRFRGHEATRVIELTVRDIDLWPDVLAGLIRSRVDRIDSVESDHSDRDALTRQALQAAVRDARARADLLAEAAGSRIHGVYSISESSRGWTEPVRPDVMVTAARTQAEAQPMPEAYEPGVIVVSSEVEAVFELRGRRSR